MVAWRTAEDAHRHQAASSSWPNAGVICLDMGIMLAVAEGGCH